MSLKKELVKRLGRPTTTPEARTNIVGVRLNDTELKAFTDWCFRYDISLSDCIREALTILSVIPDNPKQKQ